MIVIDFDSFISRRALWWKLLKSILRSALIWLMGVYGVEQGVGGGCGRWVVVIIFALSTRLNWARHVGRGRTNAQWGIANASWRSRGLKSWQKLAPLCVNYQQATAQPLPRPPFGHLPAIHCPSRASPERKVANPLRDSDPSKAQNDEQPGQRGIYLEGCGVSR